MDSTAACGSVNSYRGRMGQRLAKNMFSTIQQNWCSDVSLFVAAQINVNCGREGFVITLNFLYYFQIQNSIILHLMLLF